jgi:hypothetical protein
MAWQRLRESDKAQETLKDVREVIEREFALDGPETRDVFTGLDRPMMWCALQVVLREAESLIEPAA